MFRIMGGRRNAVRPGKAAAQPGFLPPAPGPRPLAVIGDVHGSQDLLSALLSRLATEAPGALIVFVGDLIDRGDNSDAVLETAFALRGTTVTLLGNHEEMLLEFLDDPERSGRRWLRHGGLQTLAAFGIGGMSATASGDARGARDALKSRLGPEREAWLRHLPRFSSFGNVTVTHAGADPWRAIAAQDPECFTWGHPDFGKRPRTDGMWIVHGHVIVDDPYCANGLVAVDTGAYASGRLTAALIAPEGTRFISVTR